MQRLLILTIAFLAATASGQTSETPKINQKDGLAYVWIPGGEYLMGCSAGDSECFEWEKPARRVTIRAGFWIGKTETTQEAYQRVTGAHPSRYKGPMLPVDQVSWFDAQTYCSRIGLRLPTGEEWEFAARGGLSASRYGALMDVAWYDGNGGDTTHPVGQKLANAYGLYDMLGNLWEWVQEDYTESGKNMKVLRGGSFFNLARDMRVSNRLWATPDTAHRNMGFRCAGN